jgi:hypothetical protein
MSEFAMIAVSFPVFRVLAITPGSLGGLSPTAVVNNVRGDHN